MVKIICSQVFAIKFELLFNHKNMKCGLNRGESETEKFMIPVSIKVYDFRYHRNGKDKDQIMNGLEVES